MSSGCASGASGGGDDEEGVRGEEGDLSCWEWCVASDSEVGFMDDEEFSEREKLSEVGEVGLERSSAC